jgi:hypothetical protein
MNEFFERPAVKYSILAVALVGVGFLVWFLYIRTFVRTGGFPYKETVVPLTCTNPDCPGRTHETAPPDTPESVLGPYRFERKLWTDYCDWPMTCPVCGQKSVYLKHQMSPGSYLTVYKLIDQTIICPSGAIIKIDSWSGGTYTDPRTGQGCAGSVWDVPESTH